MTEQTLPILPESNEAGVPEILQLMRHAISLDKVEAIERMAELYEREQAKIAKRAFDAAKRAFQRDCPPVPKTKDVRQSEAKGGALMYRYAPLEVIVPHIAPYLEKHGLSYSFDSEEVGSKSVSICILSHDGGHTERYHAGFSKMRIPNASDAQNESGSMTIGNRRSLLNALGLLTADMDSDGAVPEIVPDNKLISREQAADIQALLAEIPTEQRNMSKFWAMVSGWAGIEVSRVDAIPARLASRVIQALESKRKQVGG